jgi:hypothetical protein
MSERVPELTKYLLALSEAQKSGYKCSGEMSEVIRELRCEIGLVNIEDKFGLYTRKILEICGDLYSKEKQFINTQIYFAYLSQANGELYLNRGSGVTTSIKALMEVFDDVVYIKDSNYSQYSLADKVVFIEGNNEIPRGNKPKRVIRIHPFHITVSGTNYYEAVIY